MSGFTDYRRIQPIPQISFSIGGYSIAVCVPLATEARLRKTRRSKSAGSSCRTLVTELSRNR